MSTSTQTATTNKGGQPKDRRTKGQILAQIEDLDKNRRVIIDEMQRIQNRISDLSNENLELAHKLRRAEQQAKSAQDQCEQLRNKFNELQAVSMATEVAYTNALKIVSAGGTIESSQLSPIPPKLDELKSVMADLKERLNGLLNEVRAGR